ncbi:thiamine ABC transporter substrate-binding protein [Cellulomonas dongxiuzhuiae]|uniref:thiamine ABC transporter substrate-binding protein n=1 Tax=Cellulomonas dongxiuzhuiae TaxID=2819979 RepID=UPI001AB0176B|nr:thiamine ABC transporter substrate-binding protein [Cellulomonas dongxiuzhuiae]MBO3089686.1 thiamine ABC transporter substrate-binding protein [Cellulomonas dongxiuzhuiae]
MTTPRPRTAARTRARHAAVPAVAAAALLALTACSATGGPTADGATAGAGTVTLVTHESFALSDGLLERFEDESGLSVQVVQQADAGALVNQLVLTKDAPLGDLVFGIDNAFASRALDEGVVVPVELDAPAVQDAAEHAVPGDEDGALTAVDLGDVCLNVDTAWFASRGVPEPTTLESLLDPAYRDLVVVPDPVTSSPGLAFLLATVGAFGEDGWVDYWAGLRDNGLQVADGWSEAYYTDFTAGGGDGPRPVVLSYASSPPYTVPEGGDAPTTRALLDTCFRQVEYAGVLAGAANPEGAAQLLEFLLSDDVQADIPVAMYMYPVSSSVDLPPEWVSWAPLAEKPFTVAPADVAEHREQWLTTWSDTVIG